MTDSPPRRLRDRTFRSLRHRDYRLYFLGQLVSFTGSWMQSTALMWLVYDRTGDPLWPPLMLVAAVGPTLLLGPLGGAMADAIPKRRLVIATQTAFLLHAAVLTLTVASDFADPRLLLALQLVSGVVQAIDLPARLAFVPDLVPKDDLINAVGLNSLLFNAARAVGPALAGGLFLLADAAVNRWHVLPGSRVVTLGAVWCFTFNVLSYAAVLMALVRVTAGGAAGHTPSGGRFWDGVRHLIAHPTLGGLVVLTGVLSVFAWPALTLLPAYTRTVLGEGERAYSVLVSSLGAGALVAALTTATFGTVARRGRFLLTGAACGVLGLAGLASVTTLPLAGGCVGVIGFGLILYLSTGQSTIQLGSPDATRGRVMALWAMTLSASSLPGHLLGGVLARDYPVPTILAGMAAGVGCATAGLAVVIVVRRPA